ncbi:pirin family protein [Mycobacterium sp.]|jgi:redox-sensitive bicupin YhaK (pirin superfamily)|uniref:pirin family protein n=1 Tax=Mycobacterium sp. TaxID=1785 RepID=UPI002D4035E5|nr:pirin family protein [Mycobacterium sp.]HZA11782.1 pirin family protein [Mycobacterium sp.]
MSNLDPAPPELACAPSPGASVEVLHPREVPLGGPRAIRVRRTLPQRQRSLVGAWCFADHYGPHHVRESHGMAVAPHPHTGLQTISWLFSGEVEHRDSNGVHALVHPGELNLMTAGAGICHSEVSTHNTTVLHGVQLWVALPDADRDTARRFDNYLPQPVSANGATLRVFLGELAGGRSPVRTFTPLLGAQIDLDAGTGITLDLDPAYEHGVLLDRGRIEVAGARLDVGDLACQGTGHRSVTMRNNGDEPARALVLGGAPFDEQLVMWWNFVGRSHDEIVQYRRLWESHDERFGSVDGYVGSPARLPAPPLPTTPLRPRRAASRKASQ